MGDLRIPQELRSRIFGIGPCEVFENHPGETISVVGDQRGFKEQPTFALHRSPGRLGIPSGPSLDDRLQLTCVASQK